MDPDRILFIDGEALVIDKPAGLPVDPPRDGSLSLDNHMEALRFGFHRWPVAVHRLDRDTSGCLLLARNPKALARFGRAFAAGEVEKVYLAVLDGEPADDEGEIDLPLAKVSSRAEGWRSVVDARGKAARTRWRVISRMAGQALVALTPATGRTHQLRVHAASGIGVPIVGDAVYGRGGTPMLLHAAALALLRPNKEPIKANAPLPASFGCFADVYGTFDA